MNHQTTIVKIPGLDRTYTFFHTSDTHAVYALDSEPHIAKEFADRHTDKWNQDGFIPRETLDTALEDAAREKADGIFLCGDILDYYSEGTFWYVRDRLIKSGVPLYYVFGNHEDATYGYGGLPHDQAYIKFAEFMFDSPALWSKDLGAFLIVGVDNSTRQITQEQLDGLEKLMAVGKPILLLMHIPVKTDDLMEAVDAFWKGWEGASLYFTLGQETDSMLTKKFCDMLRQPDNNIKAIFAGHIHTSYEGEYAPGKMQYVSTPSYRGIIRKVIVTGTEA